MPPVKFSQLSTRLQRALPINRFATDINKALDVVARFSSQGPVIGPVSPALHIQPTLPLAADIQTTTISQVTIPKIADQDLGDRAILTIQSGPSGSGKGRVVEELLKQGLPKFVIVTTRNLREGEQYGLDYYYMTRPEWQEIVKKNGFIAFVQIHGEGDVQGVPKSILDLARSRESLFVELDINLGQQLMDAARKQGIDVRYTFVLPPNGQTHYERLLERTVKKAIEKAIKEERAEITEEEFEEMVRDIEKRLSSAPKEIMTSMDVNPLYIINGDLKEAQTAFADAISFVPPLGVLDARRRGVSDAKRVSGRLTIRDYMQMLKGSSKTTIDSRSIILSVGDPEASYVQGFKQAIVDGLKSNATDFVTQVLDPALDQVKEEAWSAMFSGHPDIFLESDEEMDNRFGIHAGTFSPYTLGHMSAGLATMLSFDLNGVVVLTGGDSPEKPLALPDTTREAMIQRALEMKVPISDTITASVGDYIHYSPLRVEMARLFADMDAEELGVEDAVQRKLFLDLMAFQWLIKMNPHLVPKVWMAGIDKINAYGEATGQIDMQLGNVRYKFRSKNEYRLVKQILADQGINISYFARGGEEIILEQIEPAGSWILPMLESGAFVESMYPSFDTSATEVRNRITQLAPVGDFLAPGTIDFLWAPVTTLKANVAIAPTTLAQASVPYSAELPDVDRGYVAEAFMLENMCKQAKKLLQRVQETAEAGDRQSPGIGQTSLVEMRRELTDRLEAINTLKSRLVRLGIISNNKPITEDDLLKI